MISWKSKVSLVPCFVKAVGPERATVVSLATSKDGCIQLLCCFYPLFHLRSQNQFGSLKRLIRTVHLERGNSACSRAPTMISPGAGH